VKAFLLALGIGLVSVLPGLGEETSAQRLENAQQGIAGGSWPKKPDNRLSPLSGKMKDTAEISPQFYGQDKEFRVRQAGEWNKEAHLGSTTRWEGTKGQAWEKARWEKDREWSGSGVVNEKFQPSADPTATPVMSYRELGVTPVTDWSSRSSRLATRPDGAPRLYEGKLTRVREQVAQKDANPRDLGPDRREQFRPEEVEKMLSQPVGEFRRAATEQSPSASPLAAADN